jgi:hypothetical protein
LSALKSLPFTTADLLDVREDHGYMKDDGALFVVSLQKPAEPGVPFV